MSNTISIEAEVDIDLDELAPHELAKSLIGRLDELDDADKGKILDELGYGDEFVDEQIKEAMIQNWTVGEIWDKLEYLPAQSKFEYFMENFDNISEDDLRKIVE